MSSEIPKTRIPASEPEQERLRGVVRQAVLMGGRIPNARVAQPEDADALAELLADQSIGPRIYTLPTEINAITMQDFILRHLDEREAGTGILFMSFNASGHATAYFDLELWPQWSAAKFGGAVRAERQGKGFGGLCGLAAMEWCFEALGASRVCETTARDNDRSIRLLRRLGMTQMGEVVSNRPDGSTRASLYWELSREDWFAAQALQRANNRQAAGARQGPGVERPTEPAATA